MSKLCQKTGYYYEDAISTLADLEFWIPRKILDKEVCFSQFNHTESTKSVFGT